MKELPTPLLNVKKEYEKMIKRYWHVRQEKTEEDKVLLWCALQNLMEFLDNEAIKLGQEVFNDMKDKKEFTFYLDEYGQKVYYDLEAKWLKLEEMDADDMLITTRRDNAKFYEEQQAKKGKK